MKRFLFGLALASALAAVPVGGAALASPTFRLALVHVVNGCHVWQAAAKTLGANATVTVKRGTRIEIRASCPMDFDITQTAGPKLVLGPTRIYAGTTRALVFKRAGVYKLTAKNVQTPEEQGLQTLGETNTPTLTVRVK